VAIKKRGHAPGLGDRGAMSALLYAEQARLRHTYRARDDVCPSRAIRIGTLKPRALMLLGIDGSAAWCVGCGSVDQAASVLDVPASKATRSGISKPQSGCCQDCEEAEDAAATRLINRQVASTERQSENVSPH